MTKHANTAARTNAILLVLRIMPDDTSSLHCAPIKTAGGLPARRKPDRYPAAPAIGFRFYESGYAAGCGWVAHICLDSLSRDCFPDSMAGRDPTEHHKVPVGDNLHVECAQASSAQLRPDLGRRERST